MKYMKFTGNGLVQSITYTEFESGKSEEDLAKANSLLITTAGRTALVEDLFKSISRIACHPDVYLEQLAAAITAERARTKDWGARDAQRIALSYLEVITEIRKVMKRMIPQIEVFENEEDEKQWRITNDKK